VSTTAAVTPPPCLVGLRSKGRTRTISHSVTLSFLGWTTHQQEDGVEEKAAQYNKRISDDDEAEAILVCDHEEETFLRLIEILITSSYQTCNSVTPYSERTARFLPIK